MHLRLLEIRLYKQQNLGLTLETWFTDFVREVADSTARDTRRSTYGALCDGVSFSLTLGRT